MAIKKYIKINGWNVLDNFFEKEVKGIYINVERSFGRAFCRCGETSASNENVHKCPKCGNIEFESYSYNMYDYNPVSVAVKYSSEEKLTPYSYKIFEHQLCGEPDNKREVINFKLKKTLVAELFEKEVKDFTSKRISYAIYPLGNNFNDILKNWKYFSKIEPILEDSSYYLLDSIEKALYLFNSFEKTMEDNLYVQYPNLGYNVLKYLSKRMQTASIEENLPLKDYLDDIGLDEEFYNVYDKVCKEKNWNRDGIFRKFYREGSSWRAEGVIIYKELDNLKKENSFGYQLVIPYIKNGVLNLEEAFNLIYRINNEPFLNDNDSKELFKAYFKENIVIKNDMHIVYSFLKDIETLEDMKIPVTKENLKLKNMNYFLNRERLSSTYKIPQDKAECFVDLFEKDPLKAIELLENRIKMTKKQLDAFINEM